jgi:hypothetical protein
VGKITDCFLAMVRHFMACFTNHLSAVLILGLFGSGQYGIIKGELGKVAIVTVSLTYVFSSL